MQTWSAPQVPSLPVRGPQVSIHDTSSGGPVATTPADVARLYVCGITPYDATHMGHAATYVAFDLLNRAWRAAGHDVHYVQNVTDVDDPLLERATKVGVAWEELALRETQLFRDDMEALRVLPPRDYIGAVESIPLVIDLVEKLRATGSVYTVDTDLYFSVTSDPAFGDVSGWDRDQMLAIFGERGGDPEREGKKDPLDCVVWRGERDGEPAWDSPFGPGRPGWHIECAAIALKHLGTGFDVQGGGSDLIFPHHEMSAGEVQVAERGDAFAKAYAHAGMVAYDGEKMSKSKGNLVFVSALRMSEVDPMAIRLTLLRQHYRSDWEWTDEQLWSSVDTLASWRDTITAGAGAPAQPVVEAVLAALANDLDAPTALAAVDTWFTTTAGGDTTDPNAAETIRALLDASLGLAL
ncbi:cysteine--1-D-myo-inosityl 2-amino-2-deoxy-alpha-D-glucopyranoside ligase [Nocardioides sp. Soil796]|uniref:cysteine--1-D-myo-inosityl 2-amino-2-deoxy-alpha-D-glucopyranoside ligase n=1 Tax=Nocardioides sp. Soil796 TaxID=1736412 RepID=UPI00070955B2|nr:cysteine--1-D-myo-inosityl 2-amino-2-deoxy-alpha-D-glucopyranoside ligase [Nocardioides sp. Soil796]KRF18252.1 cysteine--1-D-myo-inosityl 2-amino-2-deoxy-alpha-D-glucopyranoside ligase [Nocardioides sp. Soil796]